MLTGPLVRAAVRGDAIAPRFVDPGKPALLDDAEELLACFRAGAEDGRSRADLDDEVRALVGDRKDHKLLMGLVKLLADRSTFDVEAPLEPEALRDRVFRAARARAPLALDAGPLGRPVAEDVLAEVAAELGCDVEVVRDGLFADLRSAQRCRAVDVPDAAWLLHRYNVALVQALLLSASGVTIELVGPSPARLRQLFRWVKFHQLLHHATRDGRTIRLHLDGPTSILLQSSRYGMNLASFFPALLLQTCPWRLEATVLWTKARHAKTLTLTHEDGLASHLPDTGAQESREAAAFRERFLSLDSGWALEEDTAPLDLGGRAVVLPDFGFRRGERVAWLEIVGTWRRDYLARRVDLLHQHGPGNLVLAVSRKLAAAKEGLDGFEGAIVEFTNVVPAKDVLAAVETIAR